MPAILLSVLRCPDAVVPGQRRATGGEISLGRAQDCDWILEDPDNVLSRKHCTLEFFGGGWQLRDHSRNGTFVNQTAAPVGRDGVRALRDGDRILLGSYEIEVRIEEDAAPLPGHATGQGGWGAPDPFGAPAGSGFGAAPGGGFGTPGPAAGGLLPDDFDPFGDAGPPMPDHAPATAEAFLPRPVLPAGGALIPDDWDLDLSPAQPAAPVARPVPPAPVPADPPAFPPLPPAEPPAFAAPDPFAAPPAPLPPQPAPVQAAPPVAPPSWPSANPFAEAGEAPPAPLPVAAAPPPPVPAPMAQAAAGAAAAALALLLEGAKLPPAVAARAQADPEAALREAGAALRAAVAGIRALLIARADVKREFRIEQTIIRRGANNPLKFAATDDQAMAELLDPASRGTAAMQETVDDLTAHQLATLVATQAAARALLDRLAPATLEAADERGGILPGARERRLWEAYRRTHAQLLEQFEDDFDSAFGKAFARAYEQATGRKRG